MTVKLTVGKTQGSRIRRPVLAHFFEGACPNCLQILKKFFSSTRGNFEELNKSLGFP